MLRDHKEWVMTAAQHAADTYDMSLEQLGFDFNDRSVIDQCPYCWVDDAFDNFDPAPDDPENVTRIGGWG